MLNGVAVPLLGYLLSTALPLTADPRSGIVFCTICAGGLLGLKATSTWSLSLTWPHLYPVREVVIVAPADVWVADPRDRGWLTLTTSEPKSSARKRLVVFAEMVDRPNLECIEHTQSVISAIDG